MSGAPVDRFELAEDLRTRGEHHFNRQLQRLHDVTLAIKTDPDADVEALKADAAGLIGAVLAPVPPESRGEWLETAAAILAEPDPGPQSYLVDGLFVDGCIAAVVARYKAGKTYVCLEIAISIATGRPAFGSFATKRGPVIVVLEESGRAAARRRADRICQARGIDPAELIDLHFATNKGVKLNDPEWQRRVLDAAVEIEPVAVILDPLARMKGANVDESSQLEIGPVLDFIRELRNAVEGMAVIFIHHTGHENTGRMRGSSDLEAYWESKLTIKRDEDEIELLAEHREAESAGPFTFAMIFEEDPPSLRFESVDDQPDAIDAEILDYLAEHPESTFAELRKGIGRQGARTRSRLGHLEGVLGTVYRSESERRDRVGRARRATVYSISPQAGLSTVPDTGNPTDPLSPGPSTVPSSRAFRPGTRTTDHESDAVRSMAEAFDATVEEAA